MITCQLCNPQCSYSQHQHFNDQRGTSQGFIVKEAPYLELYMLEGHQPWSTTHCILTSSTNLSIAYPVITTIIEMHQFIIGVTIRQSLQEVFQSDLY